MTINKEFFKNLAQDYKLIITESEIEEHINEQEALLSKLNVLAQFDTSEAKLDNMLVEWQGVVSSGKKGNLNKEALKTVPFSQDPYIVMPKIL